MPSPTPLALMPLALLALAAGDSLPTPLYAVDGPQVAYTVEQYMDSTVTAWRAGPGVEVEPIVEDIPDGMVAVLIVPRAGEDQSTGVESLPSVADEYPVIAPGSSDGWCGRLFTIDWR